MLNEKDIDDMYAALAILTRAELELLCLDRAIRADAWSDCNLTDQQIAQWKMVLNETPISEEDQDEMNRIMTLVASQIDTK